MHVGGDDLFWFGAHILHNCCHKELIYELEVGVSRLNRCTEYIIVNDPITLFFPGFDMNFFKDRLNFLPTQMVGVVSQNVALNLLLVNEQLT